MSWRWDVEQGAQVWTTCGDIEVVDTPVDEKEWAAWDDSCAAHPYPSTMYKCEPLKKQCVADAEGRYALQSECAAICV